MEATTFTVPARATIRPWIDPVVDEHGHDPRSSYVEQFWLGVIGADRDLDHATSRRRVRQRAVGFTIDFEHTASRWG